MADRKIILTWQTTDQHRFTFKNESAWSEFVAGLSEDLDPTNLDAVYEYLNTGQGMSAEYINDLTDENSWFNQVEYEIDDLVREGEFVEEAADADR